MNSRSGTWGRHDGKSGWLLSGGYANSVAEIFGGAVSLGARVNSDQKALTSATLPYLSLTIFMLLISSGESWRTS